MKKELKVFFRQSFTEADVNAQKIIQDVIDLLHDYSKEQQIKLNIVTGDVAYHKDNFKTSFAENYQMPFSPKNFRDVRLQLLEEADVMIILRTGMSESTVYELVYNIYKAGNKPVLFLIWDHAKIKTTFIRELEDVAHINYVEFSQVGEIRPAIHQFISNYIKS